MTVEYIRYNLTTHTADALVAAYAEARKYLAAAPDYLGYDPAQCDDDAASAFDDVTVLVTQFVPGGPLSVAVGRKGSEKFAIMGDLLGRLHTLPVDEYVNRPVGRAGMILAARASGPYGGPRVP